MALLPLPISLCLQLLLWLPSYCVPSLEMAPLTSASSHSSEQLRCSPADTSPLVAVGFYGISRNLRLTLPLIEKYVFRELERNNIFYEVFWHTVIKSDITNKHTGEKEVRLDRFDARLMRPCVVELEDNDVVQKIEFEEFMKGRSQGFSKGLERAAKLYDPFNRIYKDKFESLKNMLTAFHSLQRIGLLVSSRMQSLNISYDALVVLRPDAVPVFRGIDLPVYLPRITQGTMRGVWTPNFQYWRGLNDRFAFGDVASMMVYLNRGVMYKKKHNRLNRGSGEKFLLKYLNREKISVHNSTVRVLRIRANGVIAEKDCLDEVINKEFTMEMQRCTKWTGSGRSKSVCEIKDLNFC